MCQCIFVFSTTCLSRSVFCVVFLSLSVFSISLPSLSVCIYRLTNFRGAIDDHIGKLRGQSRAALEVVIDIGELCERVDGRECRVVEDNLTGVVAIDLRKAQVSDLLVWVSFVPSLELSPLPVFLFDSFPSLSLSPSRYSSLSSLSVSLVH